MCSAANNIEHTSDTLLVIRCVTIDAVAAHLHIGHASAHEIIHDNLGFCTVCAPRVPKWLTEECE
jgi:hypothetical protein